MKKVDKSRAKVAAAYLLSSAELICGAQEEIFNADLNAERELMSAAKAVNKAMCALEEAINEKKASKKS